MRHFLIITCFAALAWATAPAALAQADLPTVESEVEPSPEPDEAGGPDATTPLEEEGPKAKQNDKGQKESGVLLSLSDPLTIARFVVTPILLWVLKNLVSYSFRRMHIARTIYVDMEYQLLFLNRAVEGLTEWLNGLSQQPPIVPYLRLSPDRHYVYPSIQSEILECMWGEEITAVRLFYRDMEQVEQCAEKIAISAGAVYALPPANLLKGRTAKVQHEVTLRREMEAFDRNLDALCKIRDFWVDTVGGTANAKNPYRGAASQCLYRPAIWHLLFTGIWSFLILVILAVLFQPIHFGENGIAPFTPWTTIAAVIVVAIMLLAKSQSDKRIKQTVVSLHPSVLKKAPPG